jgi:hypothetical protein
MRRGVASMSLKSSAVQAVKVRGMALASGFLDKGARALAVLPLAVVFFGLITPVAFIGRLRGRDELGLKRPSSRSYWTARPQREASSDSFYNQY